MTDSTPDSTTKPAPGKPRNPVLWLVVGLPAVVIVASLTTLYIAINAGGSDAIPDEVRRTAQIQTTELGPDERAATLKLSAVFSVREGHVEVLPASGALVDDKALRGQPLRLLLQHPTLAAEDRELKLAPTEAGWRAEIALDPSPRLAHPARARRHGLAPARTPARRPARRAAGARRGRRARSRRTDAR